MRRCRRVCVREVGRVLWSAAAGWACLGSAHAGGASVRQDGQGGSVQVEQVMAAGSVRVLQRGADNRATAHQQWSTGIITIEQAGALNAVAVQQSMGAADLVEVTQGGAGNRAVASQVALSPAAWPNLVGARQLGVAGALDVSQHASSAIALVHQSSASTRDIAILSQAGPAAIGVIAQGVTRPPERLSAIHFELLLARNGQLPATASTQATAVLVQAGGAGLVGIIVQSGTAPSASIAQSGAYLEAEILQSGAAHAASIAQVGIGTPAGPYRASVQQSGGVPHSISVQQVGGAGARVVRVVQQ